MNIVTKLLLVMALFVANLSMGQTLISEDFENGALPAGWSIQTLANDGGWKVGTAGALSSQFWQIAGNGSTNIIATNDDDCNCNKSADYLILPEQDLSGVDGVVLEADIFFGGSSYAGATETASVEVSTNGGNTWQVVHSLTGESGWNRKAFDLSQFSDEPSVTIALRYNDDGGWVFGLAVDNISLVVPVSLDASLIELNTIDFGEEGAAYSISGEIYNGGITTIETLEIKYQVPGEDTVSATLTGLGLAAFQSMDFAHPVDWIPSAGGVFNIPVEIGLVNGMVDEDPINNSDSFEVEIFPLVIAPNIIDDFLVADPEFTITASSIDQLDKPNDLDFFPILAKNELWVINERNESSGGSTVTFYDAGTDDQDGWHRVDGNAWHFMSLPTALEFGDNGNWASSPGVQDANHGGGTFTGPTLWSSDPEIYAQPSGGNGSHLDMLHGSPYSMGIAHEVDNVYWVFDGWNQTIVRYDFQDDHGPGNDYHGDAIVRRYLEISVTRDGNVPSHMVLDKSTGWMYIVDNGNDRVIRLDINTGQVTNLLALINEGLAEHSEVGGVTWEEIINTGLDRPSGIEIIGDRLLVGDYATGEIIVYDTENDFMELGRINTGSAGLTGIKIGPEGNIWFTNKLDNTVTKAAPGVVTGIDNLDDRNQVHVHPNPTSGTLKVQLDEDLIGDLFELKVFSTSGHMVFNSYIDKGSNEINLSQLTSGFYIVQVIADEGIVSKKIVVEK